jgi:2-haloacid dehalogenase
MLNANMQRAGIAHYFEASLSTDVVHQFKPAPAAYQLAADRLNLPKSDIGYAAFAGWDALGAAWFGYPTAWINRLGVSAEALPASFISGTDMECVLALTNRRNGREPSGLHGKFG